MSRKHAPRGPVKGIPMDGTDPMNERRQCDATNRQGQRCKRAPIPGGNVCVMHGGKAPQVQAKALERLMFMQAKALGTLDKLLDRDEFPTVQYQVAKAVIDWTEGKAAEKVAVEHSGDLVIRHEGVE